MVFKTIVLKDLRCLRIVFVALCRQLTLKNTEYKQRELK